MSDLFSNCPEKSGKEPQRHGRKATKEKMKSDSRENSKSFKRVKRNSEHDPNSSASKCRKPLEIETDTLVLQRRQKQIDYGKNTVGYHNYISQVPVSQRTKDHPKTPDKYSKYSRRSWDMLIKIWRKELHEYDVDGANEEVHLSEVESDK